jgi:hypothetical protein
MPWITLPFPWWTESSLVQDDATTPEHDATTPEHDATTPEHDAIPRKHDADRQRAAAPPLTPERAAPGARAAGDAVHAD